MTLPAAIEKPRRKLIEAMAERYGLDAESFKAAVVKSAMPVGFDVAELATCLVVADKYDLDPFTKQIYFMKTKGGTIQPIVSVDGWAHIVNRNPAHNGMDFVDNFDAEGRLISITCRIYRKDRDKPVEVTEYMEECAKGGGPAWQKTPARMLRHRAMIQCARYAYGIAGVMEPDEFNQWQASEPVDVTPRKSSAAAKRDGTSVTTFNEIRAAIVAAVDTQELREIRRTHNDFWNEAPRAWARLMDDDYDLRMSDLGAKVENATVIDEIPEFPAIATGAVGAVETTVASETEPATQEIADDERTMLANDFLAGLDAVETGEALVEYLDGVEEIMRLMDKVRQAKIDLAIKKARKRVSTKKQPA